MTPWTTASTAKIRGSDFVLARRNDEWMVRVDGRVLMTSREHGSEIVLAQKALEAHAARSPSKLPPAVLVGGLGFGYTLRAVLDLVPAEAVVTVGELVPALVDANKEVLGSLNGNAVDDPRVKVVVGDAMDLFAPGAFDVILLDVDNGPSALSQPRNARFYSELGVRKCHAALKKGGVLAVWSAGPDEPYIARLKHGGFAVEALRVEARPGGKAKHIVFLAKRLG